MASLTEWNPFKELEQMRGDFDQVLDRLRSTSWLSGEPLSRQYRAPASNPFWSMATLQFAPSCLGIDPETIDVKVATCSRSVRTVRKKRNNETRLPSASIPVRSRSALVHTIDAKYQFTNCRMATIGLGWPANDGDSYAKCTTTIGGPNEVCATTIRGPNHRSVPSRRSCLT